MLGIELPSRLVAHEMAFALGAIFRCANFSAACRHSHREPVNLPGDGGCCAWDVGAGEDKFHGYVEGSLLAMCHVILSASGQGSVGRRHTALQGQVAAADQTAHLAVADPNRQASQPHPGPRAVRLDALGDRRLETRYIWWVIFWRRVSADHYGVPIRSRRARSPPRPKSAPSIAATPSASWLPRISFGLIRLHSKGILAQGLPPSQFPTSLAMRSAERGEGGDIAAGSWFFVMVRRVTGSSPSRLSFNIFGRCNCRLQLLIRCTMLRPFPPTQRDRQEPDSRSPWRRDRRGERSIGGR